MAESILPGRPLERMEQGNLLYLCQNCILAMRSRPMLRMYLHGIFTGEYTFRVQVS